MRNTVRGGEHPVAAELVAGGKDLVHLGFRDALDVQQVPFGGHHF